MNPLVFIRRPRETFIQIFAALFVIVAVSSTALGQSGILQFEQALYTVSEAGPIAFTDAGGTKYLTPPMKVSRTGGSTGAITTSYCVWMNETTDNAVQNENYDLADNMRRWVAAGTLTWADGDSSTKTLPFTYNPFGAVRYNLTASALVQGTITYSARLTNITGGATRGANATSRLEITDAEGPAAGVINLISRRFYGADGGTATISVRRDGGSTSSVSVNYATSSTLPAVTSNQQSISAGVEGTNYLSASGTLTWAAGDNTVKTFTVTLPTTGNTNGSMNVAINLSTPTNGSELGTVSSSLLTIQNKGSTVYNINDNLDGSTYRLTLPAGKAPIRGVLFWFPGTGGDDRPFTTDPNFRKIADQWRFAIASPNKNYDSKPNRFVFPQPQLAFFFDRLAQMAKTTGREEIENAPFVLSGMSAGSYTTSLSLGIWPERTIAAIGQEGWNFPDSGENPSLNAYAKDIPTFNLAGQYDVTQSPPSKCFPAHNEFRKKGLTRSAVALCWGRNHTFGNTGATYNSVALYWLDQVMAAGRYPSNQNPTATTAPVLGSLSMASGWWGARNCTNSASPSPEYQLANGSSKYLNIAPDATFAGIKDANNALVDSWLPTESAARAYRAFVSLPTISFSAPAQFASGLSGEAVTLTINESTFGTGLTKIEFYDNNTKIGEDTTSPFSISWTPTVGGARGVTAIASNASGPVYSAFTLFLAANPDVPTITAGQTNNGVIDLPYSYQIAATGPPSSYAHTGGSLPPGVSLNTPTGILSGTPTTFGTYTPAFTATNSAGTSAAVTVILNISATACVIIYEPFNYTVGANNPDPDGGVNTNNGLPATNSGGTPAGTSTGLRNTWGTKTDVVTGLSYSQGTKTLTTSGNAGRQNATSWGGNPFSYQGMTTDPFLSQRIGNINNGNFGINGSSIYLSFLGRTSSATTDAFNLSLRYDGTANFFVSNSSGVWRLNGTTATSATVSLNTTTFFIVRFDFAAGATDTVSLWINPSLGQALGTANAVVSGINFPGIGNFQTNSSTLDAMTYDELRLGTSLAAVTPFTDSAASPLLTFRTAHDLAADGSQDLLTPGNDRVENILKYAFNMVGSGAGQGSTLSVPNASTVTTNGSAGLPLVGRNGTGKLTLTYLRRKFSTSPGITYAVEFSDSVSTWAVNTSAAESVASIDSNFERVTTTDTSSVSKRFARVVVISL